MNLRAPAVLFILTETRTTNRINMETLDKQEWNP